LLSAALSLWRGPVLADIDISARQRSLVAGLEEERLSATERRFDVGLRLSRHAELVAELTVASTEHPLHERFWCQRMVALYHAGRQAEPLAAYRAITGRLADQLGIDPGAELRTTHEAILRQTLGSPVAATA
jgi:DNA-binding SARP family transcriptional activator